MKGSVVTLSGDPWTVVDVAPAMPLAEMVAALLEDEGFVTQVRPAAGVPDVLAHLGVGESSAAVVLVPSQDAERALALIAETVTDYVGDDLEAALAALADDPDAFGVGEGDEAEGDEGEADWGADADAFAEDDGAADTEDDGAAGSEDDGRR